MRRESNEFYALKSVQEERKGYYNNIQHIIATLTSCLLLSPPS